MKFFLLRCKAWRLNNLELASPSLIQSIRDLNLAIVRNKADKSSYAFWGYSTAKLHHLTKVGNIEQFPTGKLFPWQGGVAISHDQLSFDSNFARPELRPWIWHRGSLLDIFLVPPHSKHRTPPQEIHRFLAKKLQNETAVFQGCCHVVQVREDDDQSLQWLHSGANNMEIGIPNLQCRILDPI